MAGFFVKKGDVIPYNETVIKQFADDVLLDSPVLAGNPTAPTPSTEDSDTSVATTGFVWSAIEPVSDISRVCHITGDGVASTYVAGTPVFDRSGNGNNFVNTNVVSVNSPDGKGLAFNGTSSKMVASSPVIGTTGSIFIKFKRSAIGTLQDIINTTTAVTNGVLLEFGTNNQLKFYASNGTAYVASGVLATVTDTTTWHTIHIMSDGNAYFDGVLTVAVPTTWTAGLRNMEVGTLANTNFFNGTISDFRYDSRIWTADEMARLAIDPSDIDSQVKSSSATPHSLAVRDSSGNIFSQEGTLTPTINFSGASVGVTYATQEGFFTRHGSMCSITSYIVLSNKGSSVGALRVSCLPFIAAGFQAVCLWVNGVSYTGQLSGYVENSQSYVSVVKIIEAGTSSLLTDSNVTNGASIMISATYRCG